MSALSDLTTAIKNKIIAEDPDIEGVSWFEETDPFTQGVGVAKVPKVIIDVPKFRSSGYIDQRTLEWNFYFSITGYLQKVVPDGQMLTDWTEADRIAINDWAFQTVNRIYSIHDDKQAGLVSISGFQMFGGEVECWVDLEIIPGQACFKIQLMAIVHLTDTEEG